METALSSTLRESRDQEYIIEMEDDRRFHKLTQEQVDTLDQVLTEVIPIHGRGNFPTLEIKPKDIIHVVRDRLILKKIKVRDVRLNGSTASHVLVKENGTSYKDLDIIFGVELPKLEDFQIIKEVVLSCLLDFLPKGVNKDKITALTMKEAYVQKMVKVFTEHDRWSLISLSNNSGKNVELKFVNSLRRQFEFSVDSFQIILDSMLQSYLDAEKRETLEGQKDRDSSSGFQSTLLEEQLDVEMSFKAEEAESSSDSTCYYNEKQNKQSKYSTLESGKDDERKTSESETMVLSMEHVFELSDAKIVEERNESLLLHTEPILQGNACDSDMESGRVEEQEVIKTFPVEEIKSETDSVKSEYMLDIEPVNSQTWLEVVHTDFSCLSTKGSFGERCTFRPAPITFVKQASLDSFAEYPLPPPAKRNSHSSQMVVLKHSSPKPPRKMSKKTTPVPCSHEKSDSDTRLVSHPHKDSQENMSDAATQSFDLSCASQKDSRESKELHTLCQTASENAMDSDTSINKSVLPKESVQKQGQSSEEETGVVKHVTTLNSESSPHKSIKDPNKLDQPITESTQTLQTEVPLINVNSRPCLKETDTSNFSSVSHKKDNHFCAQVEDPMLPKLPPPSESVTNPKQCSSQVMQPHISEVLPVDLNLEETPQVQICPVANTQECLLQSPQIEQTQSDVSEPPVSLPEALNVSKPDFLSSLEPSVTPTPSLETQTTTKIPAEPTSPDRSDIVYDVVEPEVLSEVCKTSTVEDSHKLQASGCSEMETCVAKTSDASATVLHEATLPSRALPSVTVLAESMYGDFEQAMDHLRYRLIATRNPEEIRGGGLLKYSNLLVRDFKPACESEIKTLERYMCSRFFIDFPDVNDQQRKIESYLRNHFIGEEKSKYDYLMTLRRVVNESTVCLMGHERRQTLNMITILALKVLGEQNIIPNANNVTCYYQPAPYMTDHNFSNYYISNGQSPLIYHPYPLHIHMQTGLV
ncbi:hypothetical protein DNTS_014715 [Danionella cerebrum]|uniref:polynucleotide adenylyltransferase n=1 Tax=Danionella cerebrum TaxID=2873325 RepID=A0A553PMN8_9TELE|nr:hypothetical protein DNTS_014715 [Danionella translucida]